MDIKTTLSFHQLRDDIRKLQATEPAVRHGHISNFHIHAYSFSLWIETLLRRRSQPKMVTWSHLVGSPPVRWRTAGMWWTAWGGLDTWKLALRMWNVSSPAGKESELEHFGLDLVGFKSSHRMSSSIKLLDQRWSLFHSRVPTGASPQVVVGILTSFRLRDFFSPQEKRGKVWIKTQQ